MVDIPKIIERLIFRKVRYQINLNRIWFCYFFHPFNLDNKFLPHWFFENLEITADMAYLTFFMVHLCQCEKNLIDRVSSCFILLSFMKICGSLKDLEKLTLCMFWTFDMATFPNWWKFLGFYYIILKIVFWDLNWLYFIPRFLLICQFRVTNQN